MSIQSQGFTPAPEQIGALARQQAVVATLSQRALSGADDAALMGEAVTAVAQALRVPFCNILERIPGTQDLRACAGAGWKGARERATVPGDPNSQAGYTLASGKSVIVEDYRKEQRFKTAPLAEGTWVASGVSVPIPGREQPLGVLAVGSPTRRVFVAEDVNFLQSVANVLAAALERHRAETTLRETNQQLRAVVHASPLAVISLDSSGCVRTWNATAERIFGWSADEVIGHPDPVLTQSNREEIYKLVDRALHGETFTEVATQVVKKGGLPVDVTVSVAPIYDGEGATSGVIAVIADMTERRRTEAAQAQLTEIIETTTDCVIITNVPGRGFFINRAGRQMLGIGQDEDASGVDLPDLYPGEAKAFIVDEAMPAAVRDGGWSGETALIGRDGHEIPVSMVMIAHKGPEGDVEFFSIIARDISEQKRFQAQLVRMANQDPLTDLYNRRRLEEELELHLAESRRYGIQGALMFIDLDQFKQINDSLGHLVGDQLLVQVAKLLRGRLRDTDIIARLGGDEFAVLLPHINADQAQVVGGKILQALQNTMVATGDRPSGVTGSIGIALFPEHGTAAGELLAHADMAMYQSKESGRNRVRVYQPDQDSQAPAVARMDWQRRIQEALEEDLFVLTAQPILDLRNNRTSHYEVLLRMMGAQGKIIPPGVFLDTAERLGLIHGIDQWVVRHAIRLIAAHKKQGRAISLVTNVSARTLADAEIVPLIQRELELSGVDPRFLALEMAESAAITNIDKAGKFAAALKQVGCRVGLDDFGVGFASFHHLKHLPVDYLKIDASFIRDLPRDTTNQQLVRTMVAVARAFGKETIAKFVSDAGTLRLLKEYGVDYAQGFHIGAEAKEITSLTVDSANVTRRG